MGYAKTKYRNIYKDIITNKYFFRTRIKNIDGISKEITRRGFNTASEASYEMALVRTTTTKVDSTMNFKELYLEYMTYNKNKIKETTYQTIENRIKLHILPYLEKKLIRNITIKDFSFWQNEILKKNFSHEYNCSLQMTLSSIINYSIKMGYLEKNNLTKLGNFKNQEIKKEILFWSYDEFQKFISVVDDTLYKNLFTTLYFTGMRLGECLALNWNDVSKEEISIKKTITRRVKGKDYVISVPKTKSSIRTIKISNLIKELLSTQKLYYQDFSDFKNDWFIFGGSVSLSETTISRKKNEYCKIADVKQIRIHDFRHSHASFLLSRGIPITVISKRLGHSDISMTLNVYSHMILEDEDKAVDLMNNL